MILRLTQVAETTWANHHSQCMKNWRKNFLENNCAMDEILKKEIKHSFIVKTFKNSKAL
jgi:hypothetical protein